MDSVILEAIAPPQPPSEATFDSREYLAPEEIDLSPLWNYALAAADSCEPSPPEAAGIMAEAAEPECCEHSPLAAASADNSSAEEKFATLVEEFNSMVAATAAAAATVPGTPLSSSSPSSPHSASSSSFEPEYTPSRGGGGGKRGKCATSARSSAKKARKVQKRVTAASPNSVELTEEELLTWSSDDYAKHIAAIAEKRRLTDREEQIIKDQKRRIKNRESAQESRERRRAQLEQLQEEVGVLKGEKLALAEENQRLRDEVERLRGAVRQFDGLRSIWNSWTASRKGVNSNAVKAAGMCLLVVLFSFGLLFNHHSSVTGPRISFFDRAPSIEAKLLSRSSAFAATTEQQAAAIAVASNPYSPSARRNLLWDESAKPSIEEIGGDDSKALPAAAAAAAAAAAPAHSLSPKHVGTNIAADASFGSSSSSSSLHAPELAVNNKANFSEAYHRFVNSNVTFLMCTELGKPLPSTSDDGQTAAAFKGDPFVVAFLPEDPSRPASEQSHLLQLTCRLVDVTRAEVRQEPTMATPVVLSAVPNFS